MAQHKWRLHSVNCHQGFDALQTQLQHCLFADRFLTSVMIRVTLDRPKRWSACIWLPEALHDPWKNFSRSVVPVCPAIRSVQGHVTLPISVSSVVWLDKPRPRLSAVPPMMMLSEEPTGCRSRRACAHGAE